jgi:hypothetical protein
MHMTDEYETRRNKDVLEMSSELLEAQRRVARLEIDLQRAIHLNAALLASLRHLLAALNAAMEAQP